ncbi:MAG: response regulator [Thiohalocapsa sp.]|nr:response regulator [Thiohalocapsa sp.]MCF7989583.1 response regulator [Thiohalocapsa sp.]
MTDTQTVFVVDDDDAMRQSLHMLLEGNGFRVSTFESARAFLEGADPNDAGCLLLDLRMPDMNGLELQEALYDHGYDLPILFLSAFADVPSTVHAIKGGAFDFLEKPIAIDTLIARIRESLAEDLERRSARGEERKIRARFEQLTPREREVMTLATRGFSNKDIALALGISTRTVENHRAHVMEKMGADNIAVLCQMAVACPLSDVPTST